MTSMMKNLKTKHLLILIFPLLIALGSCNDEWEAEQFENYVSFKAPLGSDGVSNIYVRYRGDEKTTFMQPLIISGSVSNPENIGVQVELDPDTLNTLN